MVACQRQQLVHPLPELWRLHVVGIAAWRAGGWGEAGVGVGFTLL